MNKKWDLRFLELAAFIARWSHDPSTKCGAVVVDGNRRVVSIGYNGFARGVSDTPERLQDRELKYKLTVHAERNALLFARGPVDGYILITHPFMPCAPCASMVVQAGIVRVVAPYSENPRWIEDFRLATDIFNEAGVDLVLYPSVAEVRDSV